MSGRRKGLVAVWRDALRDSELGSVVKLTGHTLSTFMDARGVAWPAKKTLAAGASISSRSVDGAVDELEHAGFVDIERSRGRASHRYQATLPATAQELRRSEWATAQITASNSAAHDTNSAAPAHESGESAESRTSRAASAATPCVHCGVGGGHHADDCETRT